LALFSPPDQELIFEPNSPLSLAAHRQAAFTHLPYYQKHVLGIGIADFHEEWNNLAMNNPYVGIICSRGHIKSTWSQSLNAQEMLSTPELIPKSQKLFRHYENMTVCYANDQTKRWHENLKSMLEFSFENLDLGYEFIKDNKLELQLRGRATNGRENKSQSFGKGMTGNIRMSHPSRVTCDDILNEQMSISFEEAERKFRGSVLGTMVPGTQLTVVGTILREGDILDKIKNKEIGGRLFKVGFYPAILNNEKYELGLEEPRVLWEHKRPFSYLMDQKDLLGEMVFEIEFLLNPISDKLALIPRHVMDTCKDTSLILGRGAAEGAKIVGGIDLQISPSDDADWTVIVSLEVLKDKWRFLNIRRFRGLRYDAQLKQVDDEYGTYNHELIICETNQFQKMFAQMLADMYEYIPIEEQTTHRYNKHDAQTGIPSLAQLYSKGKLVIPWGHKDIHTPEQIKHTREMMQIVINEAASWQYDKDKGKFVSRGRHDDTTIGTWEASLAARKIEAGFSMKMFGSV
jgi:hypothetical protein